MQFSFSIYLSSKKDSGAFPWVSSGAKNQLRLPHRESQFNNITITKKNIDKKRIGFFLTIASYSILKIKKLAITSVCYNIINKKLR